MNKTLISLALLCGAATACLPAFAQVQVDNAWVRAMVAPQKSTGAFMTLTAAQDLKLVAVSTPLTPQAEIHEMSLQDQVMRMRQIPALALPAGKPVELRPGSYHLMLMNLARPVGAGEQVPLTLVFEDAAGKRQRLELQAPARMPAPAAPAKPEHGGH